MRVFEKRVLRRMFRPKMDEVTGGWKYMVGKLEGNILLRIPKRRWKDNIKLDLNKLNGSMNCIYMAEDRNHLRTFVNKVMKLCVP
jgi:hypothetical protein